MLRLVALGHVAVIFAALAGCSSEPAAAPAAAKDAPSPGAAAEPDKAAPAEAAPVAAADAAGAHEGCIYAEGEKGDSEELECPHPPAAGGEAAEPQGPATGEGHFGSPFSLAAATAKPLSAALASAAEGDVLVTGEVEAVCQKKGCWMVVKDGDKSARVLMKDHGFAVPMDCRGKSVTIEGALTTRTFTETQVKHLAKDGGQDPEKVAGERTEHVLTASAIEITANS
jgi:hypothetical protein